MLVVRTSEGRADPICQLVGAQQTVGFDHPTRAVNPLGLYGVEPWALFGQQAADDPHPGFATALFDLPVMSGDPLSNLFGDVPGGVVLKINTQTFLPAAWSSWQHHQRNCVVIALTGRPS